MYVKNLVDGKEAPLTRGDQMVVDTWTPDGESVVVRTVGRAVYTVSVHGDHTPRLLVDTPYTEDELHLSPDGRWVAFNSDESGRWEVYVASFPGFTSKQQLSGQGGVQPQWRADGRELFYLVLDGTMMSVGVESGRDLVARQPSLLFQTRVSSSANLPHTRSRRMASASLLWTLAIVGRLHVPAESRPPRRGHREVTVPSAEDPTIASFATIWIAQASCWTGSHEGCQASAAPTQLRTRPTHPANFSRYARSVDGIDVHRRAVESFGLDERARVPSTHRARGSPPPSVFARATRLTTRAHPESRT